MPYGWGMLHMVPRKKVAPKNGPRPKNKRDRLYK